MGDASPASFRPAPLPEHPPVMLDTAREVPTPEGIELPLRIAGPVSRALAWIIDAVVRIVLFSGISIVVSVLGKLGIALMLLLWFALEWLYPSVFEVWY